MKSPGTHPITRAIALAALLAAMLTLNRDALPMIWHWLLIVAVIFAGYALTGSIIAVSLAATLLAAIHSDLGAPDITSRIVYPAIAVLALLTTLLSVIQRWRARIQATHDARWATRSKERTASRGDPR